jgi:hypothetical protein
MTKADDANELRAIVETHDRLRALVDELEANLEANEAALPGWDFRGELKRYRDELAAGDTMIAAWRKRLN